MEISLEHPLKGGKLRLWVDDELVLEEALDSRVTKKILTYRKRQGRVEANLQVSPGRRIVKVSVAWDDNVKTKRISAVFEAGATPRLRARLGGLLRKDLSLEWE